MKGAEIRAKILSDLDLDAPSTFTQDVLITRYEDCWREYVNAKDTKKKREIGKDIDRLIKGLGLNKPKAKKKTLQDYVNKHKKAEKAAN